MSSVTIANSRANRIALAQILALLGLCVFVYRSELARIISIGLKDPEAAHIFAAPVLLLILFFRRRAALSRQLSGGSIFGIALVLVGLATYLFSQWPFNFTNPQWLAIIPTAAGAILAVGGWRVLRLCLPLLLLAAIAIPIGARYYAFLIIKPETYTLEISCAMFNLLPGGIIAELDGLDLLYFRDGVSGSIALGEPHRGATLLMSYLMIGVYVTFIRVRPLWQVIVSAIAAIPLVLSCNLIRLLMHGLVTIYGGAEATSPVPRMVSMAASLVLAFGLFALLLSFLGALVAESAEPPELSDSKESVSATV